MGTSEVFGHFSSIEADSFLVFSSRRAGPIQTPGASHLPPAREPASNSKNTLLNVAPLVSQSHTLSMELTEKPTTRASELIPEKHRQSNIELSRIVLMLMIIAHHFIVHGIGYQPNVFL